MNRLLAIRTVKSSADPWFKSTFRKRRSFGNRRGLSLMEIMVVLAILLFLAVALVPSISSLLKVEQRKAAKRMVLMYQRLHDEAALRNRTFRVIFDMDNNKVKIEVGEARAVIYTSAEQRENYEEETRRKVMLMDDEEKAAWMRGRQPFEKLQANFNAEWELPRNLAIGGIYTPQYGEMITVDDLPEDPVDGPREVYSYVFANGFTEHTVIWLVDMKDPTEGWTIIVEPLSGNIRLEGELIDWEDTIDDIPDEGPSLPT